MRYKVQWSAATLDRLIEILDVIAQDKPRTAARVVDEILARVDGLADFPHQGPIFSEESGPDIRRLVVKNHIIVYQVVEDRRTIYVIAVRHARQRPLTLTDLNLR